MNENIKKCNNVAKIAGRILYNLTFSYQLFGEKYYKTYIEVKRISGNFDILPVILNEKFVDMSIKAGDYILISGEIRSYNTVDNKLEVFIFAKEVSFSCEEFYLNEINLTGYICKETVHRITPLGKKITDVFLAVNRNSGRSDYIPLIFWGKNAYIAADLKKGSLIEGVGRFQSRLYSKQIDGQYLERTAYEVSCFTINIKSEN